jgi:SAM-dependent methyltransferase
MEQALYDRPDAYDALYASKDYEREVRFVLNRFNEHGNSGDRVLVVGCGTGQHSLFLRERGFEVTGVDPNPTMLERARERSDAKFLQGQLPELSSSFDTDDPTFDLVWVPYTVFNYLTADELVQALRSLTDCLVNNGMLVFDLGDFPTMPGPALQVVPSAERDCARLYQHRAIGDDCVRMDALIFFGEEWFVDTHTLTTFDAGTVADSLNELGYAVETHDWYGDAPTVMADPAVVVAH